MRQLQAAKRQWRESRGGSVAACEAGALRSVSSPGGKGKPLEGFEHNLTFV